MQWLVCRVFAVGSLFALIVFFSSLGFRTTIYLSRQTTTQYLWTEQKKQRGDREKNLFYLEIFKTQIRYSSRRATHNIANSFVYPFSCAQKRNKLKLLIATPLYELLHTQPFFRISNSQKKLNRVNWTRLGIRCLITPQIKWNGTACAYALLHTSYLHTSQQSTLSLFIVRILLVLLPYLHLHTLLFAQEFYVYYLNGAGIGDRTYIGAIFAYSSIHLLLCVFKRHYICTT